MAFVTTSLPLPTKPTQRSRSYTPRRRRRSSVPRLALAGPERDRKSVEHPHVQHTASNWPPRAPPPRSDEYNGWSRDFLELCNAQLALLTASVSNIAQVALFFRHENPQTGALEFVPLVVHSKNDNGVSDRVWISAGSGQTALEDMKKNRVLPGGIPAERILPDYPFKAVGVQGEIMMPDGGLCIPVDYNDVLAGSIVLWPEVEITQATDGRAGAWSADDIKRVDMVARSIALGAALEGKWYANAGMLGNSRVLIDSMRALIRTTLHQIRSPVQALVTFGHLLRRKLPPGDSNRDLAKSIILESLRLNDLLKPLDDVADDLTLPEAVTTVSPWPAREANSGFDSQLGMAAEGGSQEPEVSLGGGNRSNSDMGGLQLVWLADVLLPLVKVSQVLAAEKDINFVVDIDDDTPPVITVEKFVREAVSNLIDNSLKYSPAGALVGIRCIMPDNPEPDMEGIVEVTIWDTGYGIAEDEIEKVWEFGHRGSASSHGTTHGSGLGLPIVREMLHAAGAEVSLQSPLPAALDPRNDLELNDPKTPGSIFTLRFKRPTR